MNPKEKEKLLKAGQIAKQVKELAREIIKKDKPLLEIAEQIEAKIIELGAEPAFPTNLCINETTAHYTPTPNDQTKATGLLKVDLGVHIDGYIADTAFSIDLENSEENKKLIQASEKALENAIQAVKENKSLGEIGKAIQETAEQAGFSPIQNLSGHQIEEYNLHAGLTIPNYDNNSPTTLEDGTYAIEPFITTGQGMVYESKPSGIYKIQGNASVRDSKTREIFNYILEKYQFLPFCSRWLIKEFGTRALISLKLIEQTGALHQYPQLIEKSKAKVAQSEHTLVIDGGEVEVST